MNIEVESYALTASASVLIVNVEVEGIAKTKIFSLFMDW